MAKTINLEACFQQFTETFTPKIIGELNGQHVKLVHLEGDMVPFHVHEQEDELFFVVEGELEVIDEGESSVLKAGEFCIVERGREHRVIPRGKVKVMLFEPAQIAHTGKVQAEITKIPTWL